MSLAMIEPDDTTRPDPKRPVFQYSVSGMLIWTSVVTAFLGVVAFLENPRTNDFPKGGRDLIQLCAMFGGWLLVISVGLPIAVVQGLWVREGQWTYHVRLHPRGLVIGSALGTVVGAAVGYLLGVSLAWPFPSLQQAPPGFFSLLGSFLGAIGGAFGGGLPQTRAGLLTALPLSLAAPSLFIAWNWLESDLIMRGEDYAVFVILASSAEFASVAGWWIRKAAREIADLSRSADAGDRD